jgi:hypothetical protein
MTKRILRQHVVSHFYLKGFANEAWQLQRIVLPGDRSHLIATSDATVVKDFNTVVLPDGTQSDMFERAFAIIEQPASASLREILADRWHCPRSSAWTWLRGSRCNICVQRRLVAALAITKP